LTEALIEYGLFMAKSLTLIALLVLAMILVLRARRQGAELAADTDLGQLEIVSLNDHYDDIADALRRATLPRKRYRRVAKARRKADKQRAKAEEQALRRVFVIDFHGDIMASEVGGLREIVSAVLIEAADQDEVLLRLDNAGGVVHEHGLGASELLRLRARGIRLTVAVDKVAASGGYLMASVADRILAAPFAVIGSIGVLAELPNFHRLLQRSGVDFELHTAGEYKRTLTLFGENTDEGRDKLREQLEETHRLFKAFIGRHRSGLDVDKVATGEYWNGEQALALGLVDELTTSDDFLLAARDDAELFKLRYKTRKSPVERLLGNLRSALARGAQSLGARALVAPSPLPAGRRGRVDRP
jgi:serine protease SohB